MEVTREAGMQGEAANVVFAVIMTGIESATKRLNMFSEIRLIL